MGVRKGKTGEGGFDLSPEYAYISSGFTAIGFPGLNLVHIIERLKQVWIDSVPHGHPRCQIATLLVSGAAVNW
jgi:hypothetical protein